MTTNDRDLTQDERMALRRTLEAHITEDEHRATYATSRGPITDTDPMFDGMWYGWWAHMTRHMPDRELREVAAKRVILAAHRPRTCADYPNAVCVTCRAGDPCYDEAEATVDWPCPTVRALAAIYSDLPDDHEATT